MINMAVAVELFPVTGQTLPLISSGGTSIWMTCFALGMILSVSAKREEIKEKNMKMSNSFRNSYGSYKMSHYKIILSGRWYRRAYLSCNCYCKRIKVALSRC